MSNIKEIILPVSGRTALVRRPTGHDLVEAERVAKDAGDRTYQIALLSRVVVLDGKTLPFEDFLDLDAEDLVTLFSVDLGNESLPKP